MKIVMYILTATMVFSFLNVSGQGCSDAGFCTMGSLKPHLFSDSLTTKNHSAGISAGMGIGEQSVSIYQFIAEVNLKFLTRFELQLKMPYIIADGNLGSNNGVGDLSASISGSIFSNEHSALNITAGMKFPTGSTDNGDEKSLPMPYQTGLGTYDVVLGVGFNYLQWNFSTGFQGVVKDNNKNTFTPDPDPSSPDHAYFNSFMLHRGNDVLLRVERKFSFNKINLIPGLLGIYRIEKDRILSPDDKRIALEGSDGLTLNITAALQYDYNSQSVFRIQAGSPAIVRDVRADGLTRSLVATFTYLRKF